MAILYQGVYIKKKKSIRVIPHVRPARGREAVLPPPPPNGVNHSQLYPPHKPLTLSLSFCLFLAPSISLLPLPSQCIKSLSLPELVGNACFSAFPRVL